MSNLIPKSLIKQKNVLYKFITWWDVILLAVFAFIGFIIGFSVQAETIVSVFVGIGVFLVLCVLLIPINKSHDRIYEYIIFFARFLLSTRKYTNEGLIQTKNLIPYDKFVDDTLVINKTVSSPTTYIRAIKINGNDITSLNYEDQLFVFRTIQQILKGIDVSYSIIKFDEPLVLQKQANEIMKKINKLDDNYHHDLCDEKYYYSCRYQLYCQLNNLYHPSNVLEGISEYKSFYLVVYAKSLNKCNEIIEKLSDKLRSINLDNKILNRYEMINMIKNIFNPMNNNLNNDVIDENELTVNNIFNFREIKFHYNCIEINKELLLNICAVNDYPLEVDNYWLAAIMIKTNATMIWNIGPLSNSLAKSLVNKAIVNSQASSMSINKNVERREMLNLVSSFERLADNIATGDDQLKNTEMYFINYALDRQSLEIEIKRLKDVLKDRNISVNDLFFKQAEAFNCILPRMFTANKLKLIQEMPISTIASGYPFLNNSLLDDNGLLLGFNSTKDSIVFNQFDISKDSNRKNYNMLLLGTSGSGKSFSVKKMLNWHIMNNRKVIVIDPEREYKDLCEYYNGNWIDASNGNITRINPLQILVNMDELADDDLTNNKQLIQNHLQFLEEFFTILLPNISLDQLRIISIITKSIYEKAKLFDKPILELSSDQFPTVDDFIKQLNTISEVKMRQLNIKKADLNVIKNIFNNDFANGGKYQSLYNGYSSINLNSLLSVFDINELFEKGNKNLIQAQLFLILAIIQNMVKLNANQHEIIIAVDEAHLLIDKDNQVALNFMFQMIKRIRKRNGSIILITQNPDDFLASEEIIKKTTAMINNTQYMMILNLSPKNVKDVEVMFKSYGNGLSDAEKDFIARAKRGQALFIVSGFNRHMLTIKHSNQEIKAYSNEFDQEAMIKEIESMQKQLGPHINNTKTIAKHKKNQRPKKGEIQERIVEQNDRYVSGLYETN